MQFFFKFSQIHFCLYLGQSILCQSVSRSCFWWFFCTSFQIKSNFGEFLPLWSCKVVNYVDLCGVPASLGPVIWTCRTVIWTLTISHLQRGQNGKVTRKQHQGTRLLSYMRHLLHFSLVAGYSPPLSLPPQARIELCCSSLSSAALRCICHLFTRTPTAHSFISRYTSFGLLQVCYSWRASPAAVARSRSSSSWWLKCFIAGRHALCPSTPRLAAAERFLVESRIKYSGLNKCLDSSMNWLCALVTADMKWLNIYGVRVLGHGR